MIDINVNLLSIVRITRKTVVFKLNSNDTEKEFLASHDIANRILGRQRGETNLEFAAREDDAYFYVGIKVTTLDLGIQDE